MKTTLSLLLVFGLCSQFPIQAAEKQYRLLNGRTVPASEHKLYLELIDKKVAEFGDEAYRKYGDGRVCYAGKLMMAHYGTIPKSAETQDMAIISDGFKVLDVTAEGCRISSLHDGKDIFAPELAGYSDREYRRPLMLRHVGAYTYTTAGGGSRTIPKYELGEKIPKDQYISKMSEKNKTAQSPPQNAGVK